MHTQFRLFTVTPLLIPAARPPITSRSVSRGPITIPRGTTTRRRTLNRTTGFSRTGTSTGCAFMRRRWRFRDLLRHHRVPRERKRGRPILGKTKLQTDVLIRVLRWGICKILVIQRRRKAQKMLRGHPVPSVRQKPVGVYVHCGRIVASRKRTELLPERNRVLLLPIRSAYRVGRGHENVRCPCAARAKADLCPLRKCRVGRIMAPSAVTLNTKKKRLRSFTHTKEYFRGHITKGWSGIKRIFSSA